jgi:hypothetical protein
VVVQALLWGWLTCRVMVYDTLADYASRDERRQIRANTAGAAGDRRGGRAGALPGAIWLGGVMAVVFFPFLAAAVDLAVCADFYLYRFVVRVLLHGCAGAVARARSHFEE